MEPDTPQIGDRRMIGDRRTAFNRRRAMRRRELAQTIRDFRGSMGTRDGLQSKFEGERRHLFADTRLSAAFAVPMLALIVAAISTMWLNKGLVTIWFVFTLCMHLLIVLTCHGLREILLGGTGADPLAPALHLR